MVIVEICQGLLLQKTNLIDTFKSYSLFRLKDVKTAPQFDGDFIFTENKPNI